MAIVSALSGVMYAQLEPMLGTPYPIMERLKNDGGQLVYPLFAAQNDNIDSAEPWEILAYLPGSGAGLPSVNAFAERWLAGGSQRFYLATTNSGVVAPVPAIDPEKPATRFMAPYRYGYGNVNAPAFSAGFCRAAWRARVLVDAAASMSPAGSKITILGQSAGATAALAYLAGYAGNVYPSKFQGAVCNAATQASLGNGRWNDAPRVISSMAQMYGQVLARPYVGLYADLDVYAPPDFVHRWQPVIPPESPTYLLSPGAYGHNWMATSDTTLDMVFEWVRQVHEGDTVLDRFGEPAKRLEA